MTKYSGSGWHFQHVRHSNARKYGRAGGTYAGKYIPQSEIIRHQPTNKRISDEVIRDMYYYRLIWHKVTGKTDNNGLFEKFMVAAFPDRVFQNYAEEWAERFLTGNPTQYMDSHRKKIYMDLLQKGDTYDESLFVKEGKVEDEVTERVEKQIQEQKTTKHYGKTSEAFVGKTFKNDEDGTLGLPIGEFKVISKGLLN